MQYIESSVIGVRSAVITLKRRATPLQFVLFPMVHVGEPEFFRAVADGAGECDIILAEGAPSHYAPIQAWMSKFRHDGLVDQLTALDLEKLGVPVWWEHQPDGQPASGRDRIVTRAGDAAAAVILKVAGRYGSPLRLPNLDQSDEHDDQLDSMGAGLFERAVVQRLLHDRDARLTHALRTVHKARCRKGGTVAVVWGAAHIPAAVDFLTDVLEYHLAEARWLVVAKAPA
jgi:hypothetical protein